MGLNLDEPDQQGNGVRLYPKEILGHLLLVWAIEYIEHAPTQYTKPGQPSDVVVVDVVDLSDLDGEGQPVVARCTWWRQAQLIKSLRGKVGRADPILVSMGKGTAAVGKSQPYVLTSQTQNEQAVAMAQAWWAANQDFEPSKPMPRAQVQDETPADPWAGQPDPGVSLPGLPPARPAGPPTGPTPAQETMLARIARQSLQGQDWAANHPVKQGDVPF